MLSIKEQLVLVYCLADDCLKSQAHGGNWRKSNNKPKCTDAEIIAQSDDAELFWDSDAQTDVFTCQS